MSDLYVMCSTCGKLTKGGRLPKGGDGTAYFPRRHRDKVTGAPCEGNTEEGILQSRHELRDKPEEQKAKQKTKVEEWVLTYGWKSPPSPGCRATAQDLFARPAHVRTLHFHSLESALNFGEVGTWQEIRDPAGAIVMVTGKGFIKEACPNPSLCAKQILNTRFPGMYPEAEMDATLDVTDLVSYDDGKTWSRILLGAGVNGNRNSGPKPDKISGFPNLKLSVGPEDGSVEIRYGGRESGISDSLRRDDITPPIYTIYNSAPKREPAGRAIVKKSLLVIREKPAKSGKDTTAGRSYDLLIQKDKRASAGKQKRFQVYASNIDQSIVAAGRALGIAIESGEPAATNGLTKAWKPSLFKIEWKETGGAGEAETITTKEIRGFVRGSLAIDRRMVDQTGYGGSTWKVLKWCLTHIPTGSGIVFCKARKSVEEIADALREVIPELTDGDAQVTAEIKKKARGVLEQFGIRTGPSTHGTNSTAEVEKERIFALPESAESAKSFHPVHISKSRYGMKQPAIDDPERRFYVSVIDGISKPRYGFLIGPFRRHQTALDIVEEVSRLTQAKYPWSHFYSFGTCSLPKESAFLVPGVLNDDEELREIYAQAFLNENRTEGGETK